LELPDGAALVSLSPEHFLSGALPHPRRCGHLLTRPMKGTLPDSRAAEALLASSKDAAELNMIVDLMRNDLGRVCETGSIRVSEARHVEAHPTVLQGVATVEGVPRGATTFMDLLHAVFPLASTARSNGTCRSARSCWRRRATARTGRAKRRIGSAAASSPTAIPSRSGARPSRRPRS
jgi:anthranilate/para-aminobenzoate synthase component I